MTQKIGVGLKIVDRVDNMINWWWHFPRAPPTHVSYIRMSCHYNLTFRSLLIISWGVQYWNEIYFSLTVCLHIIAIMISHNSYSLTLIERRAKRKSDFIPTKYYFLPPTLSMYCLSAAKCQLYWGGWDAYITIIDTFIHSLKRNFFEQTRPHAERKMAIYAVQR